MPTFYGNEGTPGSWTPAATVDPKFQASEDAYYESQLWDDAPSSKAKTMDFGTTLNSIFTAAGNAYSGKVQADAAKELAKTNAKNQSAVANATAKLVPIVAIGLVIFGVVLVAVMVIGKSGK